MTVISSLISIQKKYAVMLIVHFIYREYKFYLRVFSIIIESTTNK